MFDMFCKIRINLPLFLIVFNTAIASCSESDEEFHAQIKPIIWGCNDIKAKEKLSDFSSKAKQPHPLDIGRYLFYSTYKFKKSGDKKYKKLSMDYLALISELAQDTTYFKDNTFRYNFDHDNLKAGWWSGMANSAIMLGLTYANEVYGIENDEITRKLIINLTTDYTKGGSLKSIDSESHWIFEYAWPKMEGSSFKSVLNGFMFTLVCIETANQIKPNPVLDDLFAKGLNGLKKEMNQYYFDNYNWTKYSLIPSIEAPHYAVYVIILLESLNEISKKEWITLNLARRRDILKNSYRIDISGTHKKHLLFSLVGPPHPYWLDTHPIKIKLYFDDGRVIEKKSFPPRDFFQHISKRGFMDYQLGPKEMERLIKLSVIANYSGLEQVLYSISKEELEYVDDKDFYAKEISSKIWANYDGKFKDNKVLINPEDRYDSLTDDYRNNIAHILIQPNQYQVLSENEHLVLKFQTDFDIATHKIVLYTEEGGVYKRTYIPIKRGKNTIIINPIGFMGYKIKESINLIIWQISTTALDTNGVIKIDEISTVKNNFQLRNVLSDKRYIFEEKKTNGNIY